jgi:hypothetical protein
MNRREAMSAERRAKERGPKPTPYQWQILRWLELVSLCAASIASLRFNGTPVNNLKESAIGLQPLTTIQQNNFTPQLPQSRDPITLTVCVTTHPSTTSRQHHFHRAAPLYMKRRIYLCRPGVLLLTLSSKGPRAKPKGNGTTGPRDHGGWMRRAEDGWVRQARRIPARKPCAKCGQSRRAR